MTDLKRTVQPGLIEGDSSDEQRSNANARYDQDEAAWQPTSPVRPRADKALVALAPSLWPSKHARRVRWLRWRWWVADPAVTNKLADGYALTERWARHQADLAAGRIWRERVEAKRVEAEQRRAES